MGLVALKNATVVICHDTSRLGSNGFFMQENPLLFAVPLVLTQLSLISLTSITFNFFLKYLHQSSTIAQILGGVFLGPSVLGQAPRLTATLFPQRGNLILETLATFGVTLFMFSVAVKMDSRLMFKPDKTALTLGINIYIFTMIVPLAMCFAIIGSKEVGPALKRSLPIMVSSQSLMAFPAIACLLAELKIINTEVGRLAVATTMFYNLLAMSTYAFGLAFLGVLESDGLVMAIGSVMSTLAMTLIIILVFTPLMKRYLMYDRSTVIASPPLPPPSSSGLLSRETNSNIGQELQLTCLFVIIFIIAFASESIGQHFLLGPTILGLSLPDESPLGNAFVSKLDAFISGVLYPTFLTISGLKTNIYTISLHELWMTAIIVVGGFVTKLGAIIIPAIRRKIPMHDAFVLSLVLNARGINELILYNVVLTNKTISDQDFTLLVISVVLVTGVVTPLIKIFYDPSKQYIPMRRMTIQHNKKDTEMTIVACIHQQDNIPTLINLLEASFSSVENPISVVAVILMEVVGHSAPMLLAHRSHRTLESSTSRNNHIANAFQQYERQNEGTTSVEMLTNMSHFDAMHDDVCRVAVDKRANLVIMPFHKQWAIDGTVGAVNRSIQAMNKKIIEYAPCSLGILIDRGPLNGSMCIYNSRSAYHVAVVFIGGVDDVESLAYGARMSKHPGVIVTVIRYLLLRHDNSRERKHDTTIVEEYRRANIGNERFLYHEELVKDGVELAETLTSMEHKYDLILVGRNHQHSPLLFGLHEWSECPELGVIGDLLASPDTGITSSILVIQQQKMVGKVNTSVLLQINDKNMFMNDEPQASKISGPRSSMTITIDRDDKR